MGVARVRLGFACCANLPQGFFNAYRMLARRSDLDAVVHLGDYLYEYANGVKAFSRCRHFFGCDNDVTDHFFGTKGTCHIASHRTKIEGETNWRYEGPKCDKYQVEHDELFASIRAAKPINNGHYMSISSMLAIAGGLAAYTGKTLTWDECFNSKLDLTPPAYEWGPLETPQVAIPGVTKFV